MINLVTANFVVYNEAKRIVATLQKVKPHVDRIVVVDQSSTDNTCDLIATHFPEVVIGKDKCWGTCEPSRHIAAALTSSRSWILVLDADECISEEFAREMRHIDESKYQAVRLKRSLWLAGEHRFTGDYQCRYFKKGAVKFIPELHTEPQPLPKTKVYYPEYVGIWHEKTWSEQITDELSYENLLSDPSHPNRDAKLQLNVHLKLLREKGLTPEQVDAMTPEEREKLGLSLPGASKVTKEDIKK